MSTPREDPEDGAALEAEFLGLVEEIVAREDDAEEASEAAQASTLKSRFTDERRNGLL